MHKKRNGFKPKPELITWYNRYFITIYVRVQVVIDREKRGEAVRVILNYQVSP